MHLLNVALGLGCLGAAAGLYRWFDTSFASYLESVAPFVGMTPATVMTRLRPVVVLLCVGLVGAGVFVVTRPESLDVRGMMRWIRTRHPHILAVTLGVTAVVIGLVVVETAAGVLNAGRGSGFTWGGGYTPDLFCSDDRRGHALRPDMDQIVVRMVNGKTCYNARFSTDSRGLRRSPVTDPRPRPRFALFFGCSFMFGEGVRDEETLPSRFGELVPDHRPYNFAASGYGPQHTLAILQDPDWADGIQEHEGDAFYLWLDAHVARAVGSMSVMRWCPVAPYYEPTPGGGLERHGSFLTGRPLQTLAYMALGYSQTLQYLGKDVPLRFTESHFRIAAQILEESAREFRRRFPGGKFYLVLNPGTVTGHEVARLIGSDIVQVLELAYPGPWNADAYQLPWDGHPSALSHDHLARSLVGKLGKLGPH